MQKYLPMLLKLYYKLAADPKFRKMVFDVGAVEGRWLAGDLPAEEAFNQVVGLLKGYFLPEPEMKAL